MLPRCCNTNRNIVLGCTVLCIESSSPEEEDNENVVDVLMLALCIYVSESNDMCPIKPIKLGILLQTRKTGTHATCHISQQRWRHRCQRCDDTSLPLLLTLQPPALYSAEHNSACQIYVAVLLAGKWLSIGSHAKGQSQVETYYLLVSSNCLHIPQFFCGVSLLVCAMAR